MIEGDFNAMCKLYQLMPCFGPQLYTWGKLSLASPETHFFLCDFIDMSNKLPEPVQFCSRLAKLHRISESPTGQFGYHVPNLLRPISTAGGMRQLLDIILHEAPR